MELKLSDWLFQIDREATATHTLNNSQDHCMCGYCKNFYETVEVAYPEVCEFLKQFGIHVHGPSEVMPFEPNLILVCYRVHGEILEWGEQALNISGIMVLPETDVQDTFLLWVGEIPLPWVQQEDMEEVISPANLPEFLERMQNVWQLRHGTDLFYS